MQGDKQKDDEVLEAMRERHIFAKNIDLVQTVELQGKTKTIFWVITLALWLGTLVGLSQFLQGLLLLPALFLLALLQLNMNWQFKLFQALKERDLKHKHPILGPLF